jgi:hypothetical protein
MQKKIFISCSSKDGKAALTICEAIEARGYACWISSRDIGPGENFQEAIASAIGDAALMVLVFSANANNSGEIKKELALAGQMRRVVIPVRIEDVAPSGAFVYELATRQWIDVFGDWERAIQQLLAQITKIISAETGAAPRPSFKTSPPGTDGKKKPLALRGPTTRQRWRIIAVSAIVNVMLGVYGFTTCTDCTAVTSGHPDAPHIAFTQAVIYTLALIKFTGDFPLDNHHWMLFEAQITIPMTAMACFVQLAIRTFLVQTTPHR